MPARRKAVRRAAVKKRGNGNHLQETVAHIFRLNREERRERVPRRWADWMTDVFGTEWFFVLNALLFGAWIAWNLGWVPGLEPFDGYPFGMLTMTVSLEAIFLSIIVLISQNRAAKIADLREEVDFQVNVQAEREITALLRMLERIERHLHIRHKNTAEFRKMLTTLDIEKLKERVLNGKTH